MPMAAAGRLQQPAIHEPGSARDGSPLLEFQKTGADWLAARERTGLFDEMGVGKTAQAIGALDRSGAERFVVVAAAVRGVGRRGAEVLEPRAPRREGEDDPRSRLLAQAARRACSSPTKWR